MRKDDKNFFVVDANILPEVFKKVMDAKKLLEAGEAKTVQEATKMVNISRSTFYKYKDSILQFYDNFRGRTVTIALSLNNTAGALSRVLNNIAPSGANILTINQNIPINNIANVTISVETGMMQGSLSDLLNNIEKLEGVQNIKIIARE